MPKTVVHARGAAVHRGHPEDVGDACVTDSPGTTGSFNEQRRHRGNMRSRGRRAKERGKIWQGGVDPISGSHVGFGADLMDREKELTRSLRTKTFKCVKTAIMTSTAPTATTSRTHGWPKTLPLATLCLSTVTLPKMLKCSEKGRAGPATRLTTTPTVIACPVVLVNAMTSSGGIAVFDLVVIADRQGIASSVHQ